MQSAMEQDLGGIFPGWPCPSLWSSLGSSATCLGHVAEWMPSFESWRDRHADKSFCEGQERSCTYGDAGRPCLQFTCYSFFGFGSLGDLVMVLVLKTTGRERVLCFR